MIGHGFAQYTLVKKSDGTWSPIEQICNASCRRKTKLTSYNFAKEKLAESAIKKAGASATNCYFEIEFAGSKSHPLICTPTQEFYQPVRQEWVPAHSLFVGDVLLCLNGDAKLISEICFVKKKIKVYALELDGQHNYCVGYDNILTHNMALPFIFAGLCIPFGTGAAAGSATGCFLGPISLIGGAIIGGICGIAAKTMFDNHGVRNYSITFDPDAFERYRDSLYLEKGENSSADGSKPQDDATGGAQAPGKPTENDGFIPPKKWSGEKVKHPKTGQVGWPDKGGSVWVPTGPGPLAHGGPHWDVISKDGKSHINVMPGGRIRGAK